MLSNSVQITLNFPDKSFVLMASLSDKSYRVPSNLYFESFSTKNFYSSIQQTVFQKKFKAFINPSENDKNSKTFEDLTQTLVNTSKFIRATSLLNLDLVYFLIPFNNSLVIGMYEFRIQNILLEDIQGYGDYIGELVKSGHEICDLSLKVGLDIKQFEKKGAESENICKRINEKCVDIKRKISLLKREIRKKHRKFLNEEEKIKAFECLTCNTNMKDIIFLPCGHVVYCYKCLREDFKVVADFPIKKSKLFCQICLKKVKKTIHIKL